MVDSRIKGAAAEREFATEIRDELGIKLVRRLDQARGGGYDLEPPPEETGPLAAVLRGLAFEIKRYRTIEPGVLAGFWAQATRQAEAAGLVPCLAWRADRHPWKVTLPLYWFVHGVNASTDLGYTLTVHLPGFCLIVREKALSGAVGEAVSIHPNHTGYR